MSIRPGSNIVKKKAYGVVIKISIDFNGREKWAINIAVGTR